MPADVLRITTRNARFQQWEALRGNRSKRHRAGEMLVQGVRPITVAVEREWPLAAVLAPLDRRLSPWAQDVWDRADPGAVRARMAPELLAVLAEKDAEEGEDGVELVLVARTAPDDLDRIPVGPDALVLVLDRPASPGNLGSAVRSADALGADGVVVCGRAADPTDSRALRASTGSALALPVVAAPAPADVLAWVARHRERGVPLRVVGTDEAAPDDDRGADLDALDLTGPVVLVVGTEATGMSAAWRRACDHVAAIPIGGAASSLNAAASAGVALYEVARQRGFPRRR
ncbi:TrmH family RNA methyltransferase [uncultured Pseudokineococcus sp.]|uniref:TrmH family RNA methyltransferase n=1 Tax=uncultured Pseudokineococcus sp. TaxID=1642928 RepID=UPI0026330EFF|nr:TrmH family RNA methyltransferase [uncultured Pseudokineococcus sp.]